MSRQQRSVGAGLKVVDSTTLVDASTGVEYGGSDGAAKAWAFIAYAGGVPSISDSFGLDSILDNGPGDITLTWTVPFAAATYAVVATADTGALTLFASVSSLTTTTARITVLDGPTGVLTDPTAGLMVVAFGSQ